MRQVPWVPVWVGATPKDMDGGGSSPISAAGPYGAAQRSRFLESLPLCLGVSSLTFSTCLISFFIHTRGLRPPLTWATGSLSVPKLQHSLGRGVGRALQARSGTPHC